MIEREKFLDCYQCGVCVGGCPVSRVTKNYNPRRIIESLILKDEKLNSEIWLCASCYTCLERCPQKVDFPHTITLLKNLARERGEAPEEIQKIVNQIAKSGFLIPQSPAIEKRRESLNLPKPKPFKKISEIQKIFNLTRGKKT